MAESTTDIIVARSNRRESMAPMLAGSVAVHAVVLALVLFAAMIGRASEPVREVMVITLSGSQGPDSGGMTQIGGRTVQQVAPPETAPRVEPPPTPTPPKMALPPDKPIEKPRPRAETRPAPQSPAMAPSTVAQVQAESTPVETRARGTGFNGLSTTSGASGASVSIDTRDFCCNDYLETMIVTIKRNLDENQGARGTTTMKFTIHRDGTLDAIAVERTSGVVMLDRAAERALGQTKLQPLPDRYTNPTLTVQIKFLFK